MKIKKVSSKEALAIINTKEPEGLFYMKFGSMYIGIDNVLGLAFTKKFKKYKLMKKWLLGSY